MWKHSFGLGMCGNLQHMVYLIRGVETGSTFPTIVTLQVVKISNGGPKIRLCSTLNALVITIG